MKGKVGIIANPASGKDIRRLVAFGSVFDNEEKVSIVRRILLGLEAAEVEEIFIMPDTYGIGERALEGLGKRQLKPNVTLLDMEIGHGAADSTLAAQNMRAMSVASIIVLGGDGTCRAVAKGCGQVPLVPVSTGTNNVFPVMVEGTIAGLAAGVVATTDAGVTWQAKKLDIYDRDGWRDLALVDVVATKDIFVASRAIWDMDRIEAIAATRAEPDTIGLSAVAGWLSPVTPKDAAGIYLELNREEPTIVVQAPVAPGLFSTVPVGNWQQLAVGQKITLKASTSPRLLALDGEREVLVRAGEEAQIVLSAEGPWVVDIAATLRHAQNEECFQDKRI